MPRINPDEALSLVRRLSCLKGYPYHPEAEARLARALVDSGADPVRALAAVDAFTESCPTPGELGRAVAVSSAGSVGFVPRRYSAAEYKSMIAVNEDWLAAFPQHPQASGVRAETEGYRRYLGTARKDGAA